MNVLTFTCPKCGKHRLECIQEGEYSSVITRIDFEGDFDYGPIMSDNAEVIRFQCLDCGYVIEDDLGENIVDNIAVADWISENCKDAEKEIVARQIDVEVIICFFDNSWVTDYISVPYIEGENVESFKDKAIKKWEKEETEKKASIVGSSVAYVGIYHINWDAEKEDKEI